MNLPTSQNLPFDEEKLPPARRRQNRRRLLPPSSDAKAQIIQELAHRLTPSFDFFLFTFIAALVLATAILFDQSALYVLAALLVPFLSPAVGLSLAAIVGSVRFFISSLGAFLTGSLLVFSVGCVSGWISKFFPTQTYEFAVQHAHFSWADLILLSVGIILTSFLLIKSNQSRPLVTNAALAYELYLPIGVAGFGLTSHIPGLWPDGLIVFGVHLAWCALLGTLTLAVLGLRPKNIFGYTLGTTLTIVAVIAVVIVSGIGAAVTSEKALPPVQTDIVLLAENTTTVTPSSTEKPFSLFSAPTITPQPVLPTASPTNTLIPTNTSTITPSPQATPLYAKIKPNEQGGAVIRKDPNFSSPIIATLSNDYMVIVIDEYVQSDNVIWVKIRTTVENPIEGWIVRSLLITATPKPGW
jgi:hypothetical protein